MMTHEITAQVPRVNVMPKRRSKAFICLLIAAHNEELVLENTIVSAINAGLKREHIYVVDDASKDKTSEIAIGLLGSRNVARVRHSGKGLALTKAAKRFKLARRYRWIHIADADGAFSPDYFSVLHRKLRVSNAAATGYIRSLSGSYIGQYRVFEYTIGLDIMRRFQSMIGTISVIPGPTSIFRSDIFSKVSFANHTLTEDFDVTLQIHRKKLGDIQYIPQAIAYTQDPRTLKDFTRQITRWNRGTMQGIINHNIGFRFQKIDAYLSWQIFQNLLFFFNYCVWIPYLAINGYGAAAIAVAFLYDIGVTTAFVLYSGIRSKRPDIISALPLIYALRWITVFIFLRCFIETGIMRRKTRSNGQWSTAGRRYRMLPIRKEPALF